MAHEGLSALEEITNVTYQTHVVSVVVEKDSSYTQIADLQGKTAGIVEGMDETNIENALKEIETEAGVILSTEEYESLADLSDALTDGDVDAVLFNEAYRGIIEDYNISFTNDTAIIYQYEIVEELVIEEPEEEIEVAQESFNLFISGIDTYGPVSSVSRSDVNMIVTVNPNTK